MTWLTGWNYRKPITISNSGSALTDYQVSITVDTATLVTAGKLQSTCNDIRFTSSDSLTSLNYWIESGPNTVSTKIWVKITSILASPSTTTIYMYHGNTGATSASNGTNTFMYFNPINSNSDFINNFDTYDYNGGNTTFDSTKDASNGSGSIRQIGTTASFSTGKMRSKTTPFTVPATIEWDEMTDTVLLDGSSLHGMFFVADIDTQTYSQPMVYNNGAGFVTGYPTSFPSIINIKKGGIEYGSPITPTGVSINTWHHFILKVGPNGIVNVSVDASNYSLDAGPSFDLSGQSLYLAMTTNSWHMGHTNWIDNIRIRKYASPEPIFSATGGEEVLPGSIRITSTPSGAGIYIALHGQTPAWTNVYTPDPVTNLSPGFYDIRLTRSGYTDWTFANAQIMINTETQISATMLTVASIGTLSMIISPPSESPCRAGICTVDVSVTWKNTGGSSGLSDLSITVSGGTPTITPSTYSSVSFAANEEVTHTFTVSNMIAGTHSICPNPN